MTSLSGSDCEPATPQSRAPSAQSIVRHHRAQSRRTYARDEDKGEKDAMSNLRTIPPHSRLVSPESLVLTTCKWVKVSQMTTALASLAHIPSTPALRQVRHRSACHVSTAEPLRYRLTSCFHGPGKSLSHMCDYWSIVAWIW